MVAAAIEPLAAVAGRVAATGAAEGAAGATAGTEAGGVFSSFGKGALRQGAANAAFAHRGGQPQQPVTPAQTGGNLLKAASTNYSAMLQPGQFF